MPTIKLKASVGFDPRYTPGTELVIGVDVPAETVARWAGRGIYDDLDEGEVTPPSLVAPPEVTIPRPAPPVLATRPRGGKPPLVSDLRKKLKP